MKNNLKLYMRKGANALMALFLTVFAIVFGGVALFCALVAFIYKHLENKWLVRIT